ncbi:MAG TPA: glycosyltransferase [Haloplasmataceae bacterium]
MIITLVVDQYGVTTNGTTMTAMQLAESLEKKGHKVRVVAAEANGHANVYATGVKYRPILYEVSKSQGMLFAKANKDVLEKAIRGSDIVHFYLPFQLERVGKKIADRLGVPNTAGYHLQPENITSTIYLNRYQMVNTSIYRLFRRFYNQFDHVHCPSQMIADQLKRHGYTAKLHVISNGVHHRFQPKPVEKPKEFQNKFVILMVGRYSREKRQDLIIKAVQGSKYESQIQLIFAGRGPWRSHLEKLGQSLTNPILFKFFNQDELVQVMNYADLYIHASDAEIEAIACIEAFSCGLVPIISDSKISATNQFALTPDNLFRAGDAEDLRQKIEYFIENEHRRKELSRRYIEYGKSFALNHCVSRMEAMFEEAIRDHMNGNNHQ